MYKIAVENLPALFRKIAADQELYLPVKVSEQVNFKAWSEDAEVSLETLKTVKSPKDAFFPQSENLYTCKKDGKNIKSNTPCGFLCFHHLSPPRFCMISCASESTSRIPKST